MIHMLIRLDTKKPASRFRPSWVHSCKGAFPKISILSSFSSPSDKHTYFKPKGYIYGNQFVMSADVVITSSVVTVLS